MASRVNIVINGKNLASKAIKDVTKDLSSANTAGQKFGSTMDSIVKFGLGTAIAGFGASLAGMFASMKKDAAWEQTEIKFETLIGDAAKAKLILGDLQKFSAATPLSFESIADGAINLMAFGTAADDVMTEMKMMGDLSMGNTGKMERLVQAYGKLRSKGKASMEEINRFTEAGVPLLDQLAKNLGASTEEVFKLVSSGKVGFLDVQEALRDLTGEGGKFAGMLEKQADSVNGKWSTLKDTLSLTMIKVGEAMRPFTSSVLDTAITKLNSFMESEGFDKFIGTTVRWASWAMGMLPKIGAVFSFVGEVIAITARHAADALDDLRDIVIKSPVIEFLIELGGHGYEALKKGFKTGDWSDALNVGADIFKTGVVIYASLKLGEAAASSLWVSAQMAMKSSKFLTDISGVGIAGVIAGASIAVALIEATENGGWNKFASNMSLAITGGLIAGWLTKSPKAGVWVGTVLLNLELGTTLEDVNLFDKIVTPVLDWFRNPTFGTEIDQWWNDIGREIGAAIVTGITNALKLFDLVGAFLKLWEIVSTGVKALWDEKGQEIGDNFKESLWKVLTVFDLVGAFKTLWENYGVSVIDTIKGWFSFDLKPEGESISKNFGEGFIKGLENPSLLQKVSLWFKGIPELGKNILGIKSPSVVAKEMGSYFTEGFLEGMTDPTWIQEIQDAWKRMVDSLNAESTLSIDSTIAGIKGEGTTPPAPPENKKTGFSALGGSLAGSFGESQLGSLISGFGSTISSFIGGLGGAITSLGSIQAILNPLSTIFAGMMEVLGPVIDSVLSPLVGILKLLGRAIGQMLTPVIEWLSPIIGLLGEVFIWLYNKILIPIGNGLITVFNAIGIGLASIVNGVISAINWSLGWAGVNLSKVAVPNLDDGYLTAISTGDLTSAGSSYIGGGSGSGVSGSSTSVQSYNIEVHQVVQGNVIGDGGMAELGRYFVEAVEAYMGSGGRVSFVQG